MWALMTSWFTPATLFVLLNLMIGTIAVTSRFASQRTHHKYPQQDAPRLGRAPSLMERVKSFDFSSYRFEQQPYSGGEAHTQLARSPSLLERVRSFSLYSPEQAGPSAEVGGQSEEPKDEIVEKKEPQLERAPSLLERVKSIKLSFHRSDPLPTEPACETPDRKAALGQDQWARRSWSETKAGPSRKPEKLKKSASEKAASVDFEDAEALELRRPQTTRETAPFGDDEGVDAKADDFINRFKQQLKLQRLNSLLRYSRGGGK